MTDKKYRIEKDTMGEVKVEDDRLWGAQTQRSLENFSIGWEKMPREVIMSFAIIKKAAALANGQLGELDEKNAEKISEACDKILSGELDDQFPLFVWQTGSGTQTNMNVNEVIGNLTDLHPNDVVNKGQSSNDTFPTAMNIAARFILDLELIPAMVELAQNFEELSKKYQDVIKIGRTHLQDATPVTLSGEISAWKEMIDTSLKMIMVNGSLLSDLALGGTAVGSGINTHPEFDKIAINKISKITNMNFTSEKNKYYAISSRDTLVSLHGSLKMLATDLMKIANDIRWYASGPRCGIGELIIPANEPGSSIMPGKVNPTQCEALTMICTQIMGNDVTVGFAASQGNFQLNTYMPVIIYNVLQSLRLLTDGIISFNKNCVKGLKPNNEIIKKHLNESLMLVTSLSPEIGYEKAAEIAKNAHKSGRTLKEETLLSGYLSEEEFDKLIDPKTLV